MQVILGSNNKLGSLAIRLHNWSEWSHCGVIVNNEVIEATTSQGVVSSSLADFKQRYPNNKIIEIPHKGDFQKRLKDQIGKSYDWGAIFRFVFRGDWDDTDKWFCFELAAYAAGTYNSNYLDRVTATHLLMMSEEVT